MNILEQIDGKRGENLTSAVLQFLLVQSPVLRRVFFKYISSKSRIGPIKDGHLFGCLLEEPTEESNGAAKGRVDLLIETESFVIGIENKLNALLQEDQPMKYFKSIHTRAGLLEDARHSKRYQPLIVLLLPNQRIVEEDENLKKKWTAYLAKQNINDLGNSYIVVSWEGLLRAWNDSLAGSDVDETCKIMARDLDIYVKNRINFLHKLAENMSHLTGNLNHPEIANLQKVFLYQVIATVCSHDKGIETGKTYRGYNLSKSGKPDDLFAWIGFVSTDEWLRDVDKGTFNKSELVIITNDSQPLSKNFKIVDLKRMFLPEKKYGWDGSKGVAHVIKMDPAWTEFADWHEQLKPLLEALASGKVNAPFNKTA